MFTFTLCSRQVDAATSLYHSQYDQGPSFPPPRPPNSDQAMSDITNTRMMYRPPPNSVMVKVPQVSSGAAPATVGEDRGNLYQCAECNESFYNQKALNKHTRNLHQVDTILSSPSPVPNPSPKSKVQRKGTGTDTLILQVGGVRAGTRQSP